MPKHKPDPLKTLMGGPQGGGQPLLPPALGLLEAQASGIPPEANDGRNQTAHYRRDRESREFWDAFMKNLFKPRSPDTVSDSSGGFGIFASPPTPTPPPSEMESLLTLPLLLLINGLQTTSERRQ